MVVHHLTYERARHESLDDLVTLCRGCHDGYHTGKVRERKQAMKEIKSTGRMRCQDHSVQALEWAENPRAWGREFGNTPCTK